MIKLHLGCGSRKRQGWTNIDSEAKFDPDVLASAENLPMFKANSVDIIESCHLFEHLTYHQAISALIEWYRILKTSGKLYIELPDFEKCIEIMGKFKDNAGWDLGMVGIYGYPPAIKTEGLSQTHKWGWTAHSLTATLIDLGFLNVNLQPITQTWRVAAKTNRDFRLEATK